MTSFRVNVDALHQLSASLTSIHDSLESAKADFSAAADAVGSGAVAHQIRSFCSGWKDGRKTITDELDWLRQASNGAANSYDAAETSIIKNAQSGGVQTTGKQ